GNGDNMEEKAKKNSDETSRVDFDGGVHNEGPPSGNEKTDVEDSQVLQQQTEVSFDLESQYTAFIEELNRTAFTTDENMDGNNIANNSGLPSHNDLQNPISSAPAASNLSASFNVQPRDLEIRHNNENVRLPPGAKWVTDQSGQIMDIMYADGSLWSVRNSFGLQQPLFAAPS